MKKVVPRAEMILHGREWKRNGQRMVLVTGRFALLHPGHVRLLEQARSYGDVLIVALAREATAAEERGGDAASAAKREELEKLAPLDERAEIVAGLAAVDFVTDYEGETPEEFIGELAPDVVVMGAEGQAAQPATGGGPEKASGAGGPQMVRLPLEPGYSTKLLLERIAQLPA